MRSKPVKRGYRFLHTSYLDSFVKSGNVKISTAAECRVPDGHVGGRTDPFEFSRVWDPSPGSYPVPEELWRGDPHPDRHKIAISFTPNSRLVTSADAYLFCFSLKITNVMLAKMHQMFGYNCYVPINDIYEFGRQLMIADERLRESDLVDPPAGQAVVGRVAYSSKPHEVLRYQTIGSCEKHSDFAWQKEARIIWGGLAPREPFITTAPSICPTLGRPVTFA